MKNFSEDTGTPYIREGAAAAYVALSKRTLGNYRRAGVGPRHFRVGKAVVYSKSDLDEWIAYFADR